MAKADSGNYMGPMRKGGGKSKTVTAKKRVRSSEVPF